VPVPRKRKKQWWPKVARVNHSFEQNPTPARQPSPAPPRGKRRVPHLPEELLEEIRSRVGALEAELIDFRRDMHANPELSRNERRSEEHTSELQSRFDLVCRP